MSLIWRALFQPSKVYISTTNTNYNYIIFSSTGILTLVPWKHVDRKQMFYPLDHDAPLTWKNVCLPSESTAFERHIEDKEESRAQTNKSFISSGNLNLKQSWENILKPFQEIQFCIAVLNNQNLNLLNGATLKSYSILLSGRTEYENNGTKGHVWC